MNESKVRTGRPPRLSRADEFELYCYHKSGVSMKTCASMWRVSCADSESHHREVLASMLRGSSHWPASFER